MVSVILKPDEWRLSVSWLTTLPVRADRTDYHDRTVIGEKAYLA